MKWWVSALGCSLVLGACIGRESAVKEPASAAPSPSAVEASGPKPTGNLRNYHKSERSYPDLKGVLADGGSHIDVKI